MGPRKPAKSKTAQVADVKSVDKLDLASQSWTNIEKHKARRKATRNKIKAKLNSRVGEVRKRMEKRIAECQNKIKGAHAERLKRLIAAVEVRDSKQHAIAEKLAEIHEEFANLVVELGTVYEGRARAASSLDPMKGMVVGKDVAS